MTAGRGRAKPFLPRGHRAREARHRRALLLAIAALILVSLVPVLGRHVVDAIHRPLLGIDHIGALCLVALHLLLAPVHMGLHWLVAAGAGFAVASRARSAWRARRTLRPLEASSPSPDGAFARAAAAVGLDPRRMRIVDGLPAPAFTAGWFRPRIYVARALGEGTVRLDDDALAAVLAHERAHLVRRDPLRLSILRALAEMLFWLPALRALADDVADEAEIRADDATAAQVDPLALASAIVSLAAWAPAPRAGAGARPTDFGVGFVRRSLVARRVRRLTGDAVEPASRVTRRSLAAAALALAVVWTAGVVDVHPLPAAEQPAHAAYGVHCEHPDERAIAHLFCRAGAKGGWFVSGSEDCPHRTLASAHRSP